MRIKIDKSRKKWYTTNIFEYCDLGRKHGLSRVRKMKETNGAVWRKGLLISLGLVFAICAVLLVRSFLNRRDHAQGYDKVPAETPDVTAVAEDKPQDVSQTEMPQPEVSLSPSPAPVVEVPVDFDYWQQRNLDVYAWLEFPEAGIDEPLVRNPDDSYYLHRDVDGKDAFCGTLFTETAYNAEDFSDPVTIVYGHNMADGTMFGGLRRFIEGVNWKEESYRFKIYQPGRILTYEVIGGAPFGDEHILEYYDCREPYQFDGLFCALYAQRSMHTNLRNYAQPASGDQVVLLSTCMNDRKYSRYLTIGILIEDTMNPDLK